MPRSADRVSPALSVTSAVTWKTKVGSSFSGTVRSGTATNWTLNEPSVSVLTTPWAISWLWPPPHRRPYQPLHHDAELAPVLDAVGFGVPESRAHLHQERGALG